MGFECYSIGDLLLDVGTQEVSRDGTIVPVPRLSFNMLLSLARHAPNVVSAEQLQQEVWPGVVVDRGTINKRVLLLRKALGTGSGDEPYIGVVRGSGYRLLVPVERHETCPGESKQQEQPAGHASGFSSNFFRGTIASFLIIAIALILYLVLGTRPGDLSNPSSEIDTATQVAAQTIYSQNSIAVLPFIDLQDGNQHQFVGDGIAEELIGLLSAMEGLSVAARTSSFSFRDTPATISEIAAKLKVGTIVEGSIRHDGGRLCVTAQLIDARTGYHIWSQNYDRDFDQVFEVQDDIAFNIAQSLRLTLDEGEQLDSRRQMTGDIEAFKLYLKGRELLNNRIYLRTEGLLEALDMFNQAVERDPKFARGHAGVALVYWLLTSYDPSLDRQAYLMQAESSAKFALAIEPRSIDALSALAAINSERGDVLVAAKYFEQIDRMGSSNSNVIAWKSTLYVRMGYFDELIQPLIGAYQRDPLNEHIGWALADALIYAGKADQAIEILGGLEHFSYRDYYLALSHIQTGDYDEARRWLRDVRTRSGVLPATYADAVVDALEDNSQHDKAVGLLLSAVTAEQLDARIAFEALMILDSTEVYSLGLDLKNDFENLQALAQLWNSWAVNIRGDSRFKDWANSLGYVEMWRQFGWPDRCRPTRRDEFECI